MFVLLILLSATLAGAVNFGNKEYQMIMPDGQVSYAFYAIISGVISLINYSFITGFSLEFKTNVVLFSLAYAIICHLNYVVTFKSLKHNGVILSVIFSRAGSLIMPMIIYAMFFGEAQPLSTVIGAICMMVAVSLPMMGSKTGKIISMTGILCAVATMLVAAFGILSSKILVEMEGPEVIITYGFITNIFMTVISVFQLIYACIYEGTKSILKFTPKHYIVVAVITFSSNYSSVVTRWIYEYIDVITSTVVLSGVNMLVTIGISMYYKEKMTWRHIVCILLSMIATVLPVVV